MTETHLATWDWINFRRFRFRFIPPWLHNTGAVALLLIAFSSLAMDNEERFKVVIMDGALVGNPSGSWAAGSSLGLFANVGR
ncbi:hypothetical protein QBC34DRAFT_41794 [Podospora aff. communis PSN243]|uniref:Uncharacterized protein n=1 Tax=Podospora aff. communis PSN243 TaxID=3040156 RepID=A0AAV9GWT4_9PEZI|nr:hypothetical protein QBC34DRAFT_41794 [Podospora aff. communis PSN243]